MAFVVAVLIGVLTGMAYSRKGLFPAAMALVSVFLATTAALGFGTTVVHMIGSRSPYACAATMGGIALFVFAIVRGALVFLDDDVDFHPLVDRLGGAIIGSASGLLAVGFACTCLLCMPFPEKIQGASDSARQTASLVLWPYHTTTNLLPGKELLDVQTLLRKAGSQYSPYEAPAPPPLPPEDSAADNPTDEESGSFTNDD